MCLFSGFTCQKNLTGTTYLKWESRESILHNFQEQIMSERELRIS